MMTKFNYQSTRFLLSVANLEQLPADQGAEIAFVGRSNAGKSSVLNALTQNKNLARTSKTPGRTQLINLFALDDHRRLVDLPGYGYAAVPANVKKQWQALLDTYLRNRDCLQGLVLVMDIRHPLKEFDQAMLTWCSQCQLPVHVLLNKADKLTRGGAKKALQAVGDEMTRHSSLITVQLFSALKKEGLEELKKALDRWLQM